MATTSGWELKRQGRLPAGGITVQLHGGTYERGHTFELTNEDSETETSPIVYQAAADDRWELLNLPPINCRNICPRNNLRLGKSPNDQLDQRNISVHLRFLCTTIVKQALFPVAPAFLGYNEASSEEPD